MDVDALVEDVGQALDARGVVAVVLGAALVWYFVGYRPTTSSVTTAPANPGTTINVNAPPINVNAAPVPAAGASNAPAKPAGGAAP